MISGAPSPRLRSLGGRLLLVGWVVAALVTSAGVGLRLPVGRRAIAEIIETLFAQSARGRVSIGRCANATLHRIDLREVRLYEPARPGTRPREVARAARVVVRYRPWELLRNHAVLRIWVRRPRVELRFGPDGTPTLAEAVTPAPRPRAAPSSAAVWRVRILTLHATGGTVLLDDGRVPPTRVDRIGIGGRFDTRDPDGRIEAKGTLHVGPLGAPLYAVLAFEPRTTRLDARANGERLSLVFTARLSPSPVRLDLDAQAELGALVPLWPIPEAARRVRVRWVASGDSPRFAWWLDASGRGSQGSISRVRGHGTLDLGESSATGEVEATRLDLRLIVPSGPSTDLTFHSSFRTPTLRWPLTGATLDLDLRPGWAARLPVPAVQADARLTEGHIELTRLIAAEGEARARLGGRIGYDGSLDELRLWAQIPDLASGRTGGAGMRGSLTADLMLGGNLPSGIAAHGSIRASGLSAGPVAAERLSARVELSGLPDAPRGHATIEASGLAVGPYRLAQLSAHASATNSTIVADVHADGPHGERLRLDFAGRPLARGARGFRGSIGRVEVGAHSMLWRGSIRDLQVDSNGIVVTEARLAGRTERFSLSGRFSRTWADFGLELQGFSIGEGLRVAHLDVDRIAPGWGPVDGTVDVRLRWRGPPAAPWALPTGSSAPVLDLQGALRDGRIAGLVGVGVQASAELTGNVGHFDVEMQRESGGRIGLVADLPIRVGRPASEALSQGDRAIGVSARDFDLTQLSALFPELAGLSGRLDSALTVQVERGRASVDGQATIRDLSYSPIAGLSRWEVRTRWTPLAAAPGSGTRLDGEVRDAVGQLLAVSGEGRFDLISLATHSDWPSVVRATAIEGSLRLAMRPRAPRELPDFLRPRAPLGSIGSLGSIDGTVAGELSLHLIPDRPSARLRLRGSDLAGPTLPSKRPLSIEIDLQAQGDRIGAQGRMSDAQGLIAEASGHAEFDLWRVMTMAAGQTTGRASLWSELRAAPLDASARIVQVDLADLRALEGTRLGGRARGQVRLRGTVGQPAFDATFAFMALQTGDTAWRDAEATVALDGPALTAAAMGHPVQGGRVAAHLVVRAASGNLATTTPSERGRAELAGSIAVEGGPIAALSPVYADLAELAGHVDGELRLSGSVAEPLARGRIVVRDGAGELRTFGVRVAQLGATLEVDGAHAELSEFSFRSGDGSARGNVRFDLDRLVPRTFHGSLDTRQLPIEREGVRLGALTGQLDLRGRLGQERLDLSVLARGVTFRLPEQSLRSLQPLEPHPDVRMAGQSSAVAPREASGWVYAIAFDVPGDLWVNRNDLSVAVHGDGQVVFDRDGYRINAALEVPRGTMDIFNRRFEIDPGTLEFTGEPGFDPRIQLSLHRDTSVARIWADIGGRLMTPSLTFRSEPALSTSQILALLLTGRVEVPTAADQERLQASANQQALSFLEGLSLGILQRQLGEDLPSELPVVSIEPGREGLSDARLRAGRQVADNVYVEYSHNLGAQSGQNTAQVRVQWRLTRRWSVESFFGDAGSGGVDVVYTFRY